MSRSALWSKLQGMTLTQCTFQKKIHVEIISKRIVERHIPQHILFRNLVMNLINLMLIFKFITIILLIAQSKPQIPIIVQIMDLYHCNHSKNLNFRLKSKSWTVLNRKEDLQQFRNYLFYNFNVPRFWKSMSRSAH